MAKSLHDLPRPGLIGVAIRTTLGIAVIYFLGIPCIRDAASFFDGFDDPMDSVILVILLAVYWRPVVNELFQRSWGWWPSVIALTGLGVTVFAGFSLGKPFGPAYGIYLWTWAMLFSALLGPALLLAAMLRTPGCEMRSYMDLWTRIRGGNPHTVACPGWIDRFDQVRLFGQW